MPNRIRPMRLNALLALVTVTLGWGGGRASAVNLTYVTTTHYQIRTDLDPALVADLGQRMDHMYEEYSRRFSHMVTLRPAKRQPVYLFRKRADYLALVGPLYPNTGGIYVGRGRGFLAAFVEGQGRDALRRILQHEAFHQFVHEELPHDLPVWLNEGMAQIYEEAIWTGHEFWMGQVPPSRVRQLEFDLKNNRMRNLKTLGTLSGQDWAKAFVGDLSAGTTQYNNAWAVVYFMIHYQDHDGQQPYRARLISIFQLICNGADAANAFNQTFPDAAVVNEQFLAYAKTLTPTPKAIMIERQGILADLIDGLQQRQPLPGNISDLRRDLLHAGARLAYKGAGVEWFSDPTLASYFCNIDGRPFTSDELLMEYKPGAKLPEIICRCFEHYQLRTRFYDADGKPEHESLFELLPGAPATAPPSTSTTRH